jgi:hypothetical protein
MQLTLHIGLEKTATSLIQNQLISNDNYLYIGHNVKTEDSCKELNRTWNNFVISDFQSKKSKTISKDLCMLLNDLSSGNNKHLLISDERLASLFNFDTDAIFCELIKILSDCSNIELKAVVITTREPASWIISHMSYHYLYWWLHNINTPKKLVRAFIKKNKLSQEIFSFHENIILSVRKFFRNTSITEIPYEDLLNEPIIWKSKIKEAFGIDIEISEVNKNKNENHWPLNSRNLYMRGLKRSPLKTIRKLALFFRRQDFLKDSKCLSTKDVVYLKKFTELINHKSFNIVGSGSRKTIYLPIENFIFANTSFVRVKNYKNYQIPAIILAESFFDISSVFSLKASDKLIKIRKDKFDSLKGLSVSNIFTISAMSEDKIKLGLQELDINYNNLFIITPREFYGIMIKNFWKNLNFSQISFYFLAILFNRKPKPKLRPSNGMCAAIFFKYSLAINPKIILDGILSKNSFYGTEQNKYELNNVHETIDKMILKMICEDANETEAII